MTIEQYLECSADILEKMTDQQLEEHFKEMFVITRPELGAIPRKEPRATSAISTTKNTPSKPMTEEDLIKRAKREKAAAIAKEMGFGDLFGGRL